MSCLRASTRLASRRAGLSEAERLWLEEHLQGCDRCRADARALDAMTALVQEAGETSIGERGLARALGNALREGGPQASATPVVRPLRRIVLSFSVGSALVAAGLLLWLVAGPGRASQDLGAAVRGVDPAQALALAEPRVVPPGEPVRLAHAEVLLDKGGAAEWDAAATTVALRSGRVTVQVDSAPKRRFRVATERFLVEVVGTRFEVTTDGVEVHEGTVRVLAPDGTPLVVALSAGGRWQVKSTVASSGRPRAPRAAEPRPEPPAAGPLLAEARRQLAGGAADAARKLVDDALDAAPSRPERAEAATLLAEADLVDGRKVSAGDRYARVAERFADLPAGENALFAAASLAAREGRDAVARKLARRYLKRYPKGRFRTDVRALVERLAP